MAQPVAAEQVVLFVPAQTPESLQNIGFKIVVTGPSNMVCVAERSEDLVSWQPFETNACFGIERSIVDRTVSNLGSRFYRIRIPH